GDRNAEAHRAASQLARVVVVFTRVAIDVETRADPATQEIGLGERQRVVARVPAAAGRHTDRLAAAKEIALGNRTFDSKAPTRAATGGVTAADREFAGGLLDHVDDENHLVGLRTRRGRHVDGSEEIERLEPALRTSDEHLIEGVAFAE